MSNLVCKKCGNPDEENTYCWMKCMKCVEHENVDLECVYCAENGVSIYHSKARCPFNPLSSNGRNAASEAENGGSNPSDGTKQKFIGMDEGVDIKLERDFDGIVTGIEATCRGCKNFSVWYR